MSNQLELRHFRYFLAVAEDLHFRKASERLFISQPALSRQIKQMEEDLGLQLFERNNRKVALTPAGHYLKKELTEQLKNLAHILNHAKLLEDGKFGKLTFGYVGSAMQKVIPDVLIRLKKEQPNIKFELQEMDNKTQIERLLSQEIDVGFVRLNRIPIGLSMLAVLEESFCLVLPQQHTINTNNFKSLQQLKDEPFILFDPSDSPSYFEKVMQIFDDSNFTPIVSHNTINAASIYKLVENNLGLSIVPKSLTEGYNMRVKFIELKKIKQRTTLSIVWRTNSKNPMLPILIKNITKQHL